MATTSGLDVLSQSQITAPQEQKGDEYTPSSPMQGTADEPHNNGGISKEDQQRLIALVRKYKDQWSQDRLVLTQKTAANIELFKGNTNFTFASGMDGFGNSGWSYTGGGAHDQDSDDDSLLVGSTNFYQLLYLGWASALIPQLPKSKFRPEDADSPEDVTLAKKAQIIIDYVERMNKENSLYRAQLFCMYNGGTAFRCTRYVVDADRGGTKPQPIFDTTDTEILPERYHCFNCGTDTPAAMQPEACPQCGSPLGEDSHFEPVIGPVTRQIGTEQVPIGFTAQNIYSPLEVDVDPRAEKIKDSPIVDLEYEVHLAALRAAYPDMYDKIQASATSELSTNGSQDRIWRQQVYSQTDGQSSILTDQRPTLSKSWIQPWAFDLDDDREFGKRMRQAFPTGCLLINTGATFLSATEDNPNKRWTMARCHEGMGAYTTCPGDVVRPFQITYSDVAAMLKDAIERMAFGITLADNDLINSKAMQGKKLLAGILNPVNLKQTGAPGSRRLQDALFQFQVALNIAELLEYLRYVMTSAQMFAGIQPQTYGGKADPDVQTAAGQQQQLETAMGVIGVYWQNIKEEHAEADQLAVDCTQENLTEDMKYAIEEKGAEFRNQKVTIDDLQGNVHAYSDIDQGLPVTASELRERWMALVQQAPTNPLVQALMDEPENQEQAVDAIGLPGIVVPGGAMRTKTLAAIATLLKSPPLPNGQPTVMPNPLVDDFTILKAVVREYAQNNYDLPQDNPDGWQNLLAFYTAATAAETQQQTQAASQGEVVKAQAAVAGNQVIKANNPPPQLPPQDQSFIAALRQLAIPVVDDAAKIAATPPLPQGSSLQAQAAMVNNLLNFIAKVEQMAADKMAPQGQ